MKIRAIIGLGNPGMQYYYNRHTIGFRVLDALCQQRDGVWQSREYMDVATITIHNSPILLIKPKTFMNTSGKVIPFLNKQGIKPENIVVVHDELELPFGSIKLKIGGSARGHNGLRSIIEYGGPDFARLRFGIGRPEQREEVADYVLRDFTQQEETVIAQIMPQILEMIEKIIQG